MICDFDWVGNLNLINIEVLMLILPRGVHSKWSVTTEMFLVERYFLSTKPTHCTALPKKHQHTWLNIDNSTKILIFGNAKFSVRIDIYYGINIMLKNAVYINI